MLSLLQAIAAVAAAEKAPADTQVVMSKRLSMTAEDLLKCSWQREDEAEEEHTTGSNTEYGNKHWLHLTGLMLYSVHINCHHPQWIAYWGIKVDIMVNSVNWHQPRIADSTAGFTWKGQTAPITQLLTVLISCAPDPSQQLLQLADDVLRGVPGKVPAKEALNPYGGYSALCSATLVTWYK